mgnify:CR=1 FL=1
MSRVRKSTMVELVSELKLLRDSIPQNRKQLLEETIAEAEAGEYHDFKNKKYACGKVEVVGRLSHLGADALAVKVMNGEFDEEADEEDKAEMRKHLPPSAWKTFGLEPKVQA